MFAYLKSFYQLVILSSKYLEQHQLTFKIANQTNLPWELEE